ncbi:MAG: hypothetical protein V4628_16180 [Pseudomonadota bacterium]
MINQLFRTQFESNLTAFIVFLALNTLLGVALLTLNYDDWATPGEFSVGISFWLLLFCIVAGGLSLLRHNRERSSRLYAQLPVTSLEIRIAHWSHAALYLLISSLMLLLISFYAATTSFTDTLLFTLLHFFHAGALLAIVSIVMSNNLRLIPDEVRKRTIVYFLLATSITFLFLFAIGFIVAGYIHMEKEGIEKWWLLTLIMSVLCAALVTFDIHLFRKKAGYLD